MQNFITFSFLAFIILLLHPPPLIIRISFISISITDCYLALLDYSLDFWPFILFALWDIGSWLELEFLLPEVTLKTN